MAAQLIGILVALVGVGIWAIVQSGRSAAHKRAQQAYIPPPAPQGQLGGGGLQMQPPVYGAPTGGMAYGQTAPACKQCMQPGRFIPESNAWACDRCRTWIAPG